MTRRPKPASVVAGSGYGAVAQLGERLNGIQEVRGSIPLGSIPVGVGSAGWLTVATVTLTDRVYHAGIAQLVEHNLAKVGVAGSSPVSRSAGRCLWVVSSVG